jgi:hypothetical protein
MQAGFWGSAGASLMETSVVSPDFLTTIERPSVGGLGAAGP